MPEFIAANTTIVQSRSDSKVNDGLIQTKQRVWTDSYTFSGEAIADTLVIAQLPVGAKVQSVEVYHAALGGSTTLAIGDDVDDDRYLAATATDTAGKLTSNLVGGFNYVTLAATDSNESTGLIKLLVGGAAVTGEVKTAVKYTLS